ncbi:hypothetical protein HZS55_15860 [Halosimplex rubrum]|uniref:Uncharacterized protein n=1 Tax=Halosimplex rubrum TaxID=869889 RepID=A0A7D5TN11_9EURY|nr:hypothetical protein [Halosimplex rubrum]QLH78672.1 hypothetical protein HZS55_15860 [Halosimplex rubrum]
MPRTETYDLRDEARQNSNRQDELAEKIAEFEDGNPLIQRKARRGKQLERQYKGLMWALNEDEDGDERERDPIESVTLSELTAGTHLRAGARAEADTAELDVPNGTDIQRLYRVATAVEDADFLDDDANFDETLVAVSQLKPQLFDWLEERVDELSTPEVEGNGFAQRVADAASDENE